MIKIGRYQSLTIGRLAEPGAYLTDGQDEVLLPNRFAGVSPNVGEELRVFVYTDSEDRPVATTQRPLAVEGGFATMECVDSTRVGAFMHWGLDKDLLVPYAEQHSPMRAGQSYVVRVALDEKTERLVGSTRLSRYFQIAPLSIKVGEQVGILAYRLAEHGILVVVDNLYGGLVFDIDGGNTLRVGDRRDGYVKRVRDDGRIAITLIKEGFSAAIAESPRILELLRSSSGYLPYGDRSSPEEIRQVFGMSKATFKKLIGQLFREGKIKIEPHGIRIVQERC
jgi:predicted RNA-binding protein (virulence factor B family)